MSEVIDFYQQQAKQELSTIPWLAELQTKGLHEFLRRGFPTRHHEDWKYTVVDTLLQQRFIQQRQNQTSRIKPEFQSDLYLTLQNGQVFNENELASHLPKGVLIQSLATALEQHADKIKPYLGQVLRHEHGFQALNTAMLRCGVVVYLAAGVRVEQPIVLSHWQDQENQAVHNRYLIIAEEGSQATIIEDYQGAEACQYFTNTVTEAFVAKNANLVHYKIQRESKSAYHIGHLSVKQDSASQIDSHLLSLGGKLVRSDIDLHLQEENARCLLNGIYVPTDGQHMDQHTTIHHLVPNCHSEQNYKGILNGRSRAVFNGKVFVAKDAQHTQAHQQNKNLLLSAQAEIDTKPQLEIFADDVICSHGATVGQLDEEALFYLATRGIDRREATSYLIRAFAADNIGLVSNPALADWMANLLNEQLR
ncbi:ABC transporter permease [Legionella nautarum]|uniref:ABC transporter permease n=1 Tax=Legionella nautarum TaxID=45070 RepID=A0A0W0WKI3_9GAMM|nr:Fe-S cluster assembly protein SufD [Legionella nautarum]KTD32836.1 ABC transporter permease [Legionella nautarum]